MRTSVTLRPTVKACLPFRRMSLPLAVSRNRPCPLVVSLDKKSEIGRGVRGSGDVVGLRWTFFLAHLPRTSPRYAVRYPHNVASTKPGPKRRQARVVSRMAKVESHGLWTWNFRLATFFYRITASIWGSGLASTFIVSSSCSIRSSLVLPSASALKLVIRRWRKTAGATAAMS